MNSSENKSSSEHASTVDSPKGEFEISLNALARSQDYFVIFYDLQLAEHIVRAATVWFLT